jgi:hypothetical protein
MKTITEMVEVMLHFGMGGEVEVNHGDDNWHPVGKLNSRWNWGINDYRIKKVDPHAELKEAVVDPTKQVRIKGKGEWLDAGADWSWKYPPENYEIRDKRKEDKPKPVKKVKLLAWYDGQYICWCEQNTPPRSHWKRVPMQDKVIEVEG